MVFLSNLSFLFSQWRRDTWSCVAQDHNARAVRHVRARHVYTQPTKRLTTNICFCDCDVILNNVCCIKSYTFINNFISSVWKYHQILYSTSICVYLGLCGSVLDIGLVCRTLGGVYQTKFSCQTLLSPSLLHYLSPALTSHPIVLQITLAAASAISLITWQLAKLTTPLYSLPNYDLNKVRNKHLKLFTYIL